MKPQVYDKDIKCVVCILFFFIAVLLYFEIEAIFSLLSKQLLGNCVGDANGAAMKLSTCYEINNSDLSSVVVRSQSMVWRTCPCSHALTHGMLRIYKLIHLNSTPSTVP